MLWALGQIFNISALRVRPRTFLIWSFSYLNVGVKPPVKRPDKREKEMKPPSLIWGLKTRCLPYLNTSVMFELPTRLFPAHLEIGSHVFLETGWFSWIQ